MKRLLLLLMALLLVIPTALAEDAPVIPTAIIEYDTKDTDDSYALSVLTEPLPENYLQRWEKVRLSDGREGWVCTVFDLRAETHATTTLMDGATQATIASHTTEMGYFADIQARWEQVKGTPFALWALEEKQLFHRLYVLMPSYGQPAATDIAPEMALSLALSALGLESSAGFEVGYGYLLGEENVSNGMWEVYLVQGGATIHKVNLDALTGEILYVEADDEGNG